MNKVLLLWNYGSSVGEVNDHRNTGVETSLGVVTSRVVGTFPSTAVESSGPDSPVPRPESETRGWTRRTPPTHVLRGSLPPLLSKSLIDPTLSRNHTCLLSPSPHRSLVQYRIERGGVLSAKPVIVESHRVKENSRLYWGGRVQQSSTSFTMV